MNSDGSGKTQVTDISEPYGPARISWLDEDTVIYYSGPAPAVGDLRCIDLDGTHDQLFFSGADSYGDYEPSGGHGINSDNTHMAVCCQPGGWAPKNDLYLVDLLTMDYWPLYVDPDDNHSDCCPVFSADDLGIYWLHYDSSGSPVSDNAIRYISISDGSWTVIRPAGPIEIYLWCLSADGSHLVYSGHDKLLAWDLDTSMEEVLFEGSDGISGADWGYLYHQPMEFNNDPVLISASTGGTVDFQINAGFDAADKDYLIFGSITGTLPGIPLPGGMDLLPLNWDFFSDFVVSQWNSSVFPDFKGTLDAVGFASAHLDTLGPASLAIGAKLYFAAVWRGDYAYNFASNPVCVDFIVD